MDPEKKMDFSANAEVVSGQLYPLHPEILKNVLTNGSPCKEVQRERVTC